MTTNKPFIGFNLDPELLAHLDDFRFNNRIKSRAQAIEIILRAGMDALKDEYPELDLNTKLETEKKTENDVVTKSV